MRWWFLLGTQLVGCATAGPADDPNNTRTDGGFVHVDGNNNIHPIDAFISHIDAPPGQQTKTLDENTSDTIMAYTGVACPAADEGTAANNYYRVFDPATFGITTDFHVTQISFQVEDCESAADNGTPVTVRVGTYSTTPGNTLSAASMTVLASAANVQVPEVDEGQTTTPGGTVNAPINATIPAGSKLFAEVDVPDGDFDHYFYMGANTNGEMGDGYLKSPSGCNPAPTTPTNISTVAGSETDILLTVTGTY